MSALHLKNALLTLGVTQGELADEVGLTRARMNELVNHAHWPRGTSRDDLKKKILEFFRKREFPTRGLFQLADRVDERSEEDLVPVKFPPLRQPRAATPPSPPVEDEVAMLLRKQTLQPSTRQHFQLVRDPFADPAEQEDVFLNSEIRYVRESMYQATRHAGFLAVVGESGAGKTTLLDELGSRIEREDQSVFCIRPYMLASEARDVVGKTLRSHHIAEAIMSTIAPNAPHRASPEARFAQLHQCLRDSARSGHSHLLMIDEAHSMPLATLKHLKRFRELKDGMRPLLAIILSGQPELGVKLSEQNPEVREVVQRIEILKLPPLGQSLEPYLKHRFHRIGMDVTKIFTRDAFDALRAKLTRGTGTLLYPLAVANLSTAAMNSAAELKLPAVTGDVVKGI